MTDCGHVVGPDDPVFIHARCHPSSPTWVRYYGKLDRIEIECAACGQVISTLALRCKECPK